MGLILAMAGNAVGLGNFLRFPVQVIQNGGGAFIIPYLVSFLVMGIPLLWIEWSTGRLGGRFGHHSTPFVMDSIGKHRIWKYIGVFGIFTNIAVASYYCFIESWTMSYVYHSIVGTFGGMSQGQVADFFIKYVTVAETTTGIPYEAVIFFVLCLALNTWILSKGISGIEKVAKVALPLLILFGGVLAFVGLTLGTSAATGEHPDANSWAGINFLWTPQFDSITNPKVWLAAAGQIFFTLSVGMGTIHCYASYLRSKDDIALNGITAGFTNEFVEVVLGSLIVVPIAAGYLGLDWVRENVGFGMAFQTMPFLFQKWGALLGALGGVMWFGLLFIAGVTSSLAMGTPWMGFMQDEFKFSRKLGAWTFGLLVLIFGLPTVLLFSHGVFDEYDYWAGTVSLVIFGLCEVILFSWVFGLTRGWKEITDGADIRVPRIYRPIIKYVTPVFLIFVFFGSLITPTTSKILELNAPNAAVEALLVEKGFENTGAGRLEALSSTVNAGFGSELRLEKFLIQQGVSLEEFSISDSQNWADLFRSMFNSEPLALDDSAILAQVVNRGINRQIENAPDAATRESLEERKFYINVARSLLLLLFTIIASLVFVADRKHKKAQRV
jgi:SNF family Na+-dependent transporter